MTVQDRRYRPDIHVYNYSISRGGLKRLTVTGDLVQFDVMSLRYSGRIPLGVRQSRLRITDPRYSRFINSSLPTSRISDMFRLAYIYGRSYTK